jgi:hypothetical protein
MNEVKEAGWAVGRNVRPVYDETSMHDGYVSLEVSPLLAYAARPDGQAHLPAIPGVLQRTALAGPGRPGCPNTAAALGQHGDQEPQLP